MRLFALAALAAALLSVGLIVGREGEETARIPQPVEPTTASIAYFCGMAVLDHSGPKGQIFLKGKPEPIWFASVRDTVAFTLLPEEPKEIVAIYVTDMGKAEGWVKPQPGAWAEARKAWYVLGSEYDAGMGGREIVPFSSQADAARFVARFGGRLARLTDVPGDYVLGPDPSPGGQAAASNHQTHVPGHVP